MGEVDLGKNLPTTSSEEPVLANSLLCFVLTGLSVRIRIPVGYFFTKMNILAMQLLCSGHLTHCIEHPQDPRRKLFLAFDHCYLIKNVRSQSLARDLSKDGKVSTSHLKNLYRMQQGSLVKPVRFLTGKHVFPSNIEKINVCRAVQLLSPPVTTVLKLLQEQAGHTCDMSFASAGPSVVFIDTMYCWFMLMDVSNCVHHIHQKLPDSMQYESVDDVRLTWLTTSFLHYLEMKRHCQSEQSLSKETYHGLVMTITSNVECVKYVLEVAGFKFVLTRRFSSDPIGSCFGWLNRSANSNDQTDA